MFSWDSEVDFEIWVLGLVKIVFEKLIASAYERHTEIGKKNIFPRLRESPLGVGATHAT